MSKTYRQSSKPTNTMAEQKDPDNIYLHRMRVRRLISEQIRDSILAVSTRLEDELYGPSIPVHLTPFMTGRGGVDGGPLDGEGRRSIYLAPRRNFLSPMMLVFDFPAPFSSIGNRTVSNVPAQALTMMNDPFIHEMSEFWADKLMISGLKGEQLITHIFESALGHPPTEEQMTLAEEFLNGEQTLANLKNLCHVVMNMKAFIYLN